LPGAVEVNAPPDPASVSPRPVRTSRRGSACWIVRASSTLALIRPLVDEEAHRGLAASPSHCPSSGACAKEHPQGTLHLHTSNQSPVSRQRWTSAIASSSHSDG
jgi:hypothetical protein